MTMSVGKEVKRLGVLGSGQMGAGIAQVAGQFGFEVVLADISLEVAERGKKKIASQLAKLVEKGKMAEAESAKIVNAIRPVEGMRAFADCDMVVEAVTENPELKFKIFKDLDEACPPGVILATNTSSISITAIAAKTKRPELVAGIHFMNPVPLMKLVEGIRGLQTSDETFNSIRSVAERMGKTFVEIKDFPGFVVNRVLMPMINEAITALYEGVASKEDIDAAMKLGTNQPMGPLALADLVGLDTVLAIMEVLHEGMGDSKYRPCPLLKNYVAAGWLGRKTGRGFYKYES